MHYVTLVLNQLNEVAQFVPFDDVIYAPILSAALVLIKKFAKIDNGEIMLKLTVLGSLLSGVGVYLLAHNGDNPQIAAVSATIIGLASQPFYKLVLRPLLSAVAKKWAAEVAKAAQFNLDVKSAAVPATGLPITVETQDFSQ